MNFKTQIEICLEHTLHECIGTKLIASKNVLILHFFQITFMNIWILTVVQTNHFPRKLYYFHQVPNVII